MALITDKPEDLAPSNDLDDVQDPDEQPTGERAEIYLSGAHVATLDNAPLGRERITLMVELEVVEESIRFTENGETEVPIRRCRRVGDMWRPGTPKPPTKEELQAQVAAAKAKAAAEKAAQEAAEASEQDENTPPMFDEDGDPIESPPADVAEDQGDGTGDADDVSPAEKLDGSNVPAFSGATS
jgi:hypothetical protein